MITQPYSTPTPAFTKGGIPLNQSSGTGSQSQATNNGQRDRDVLGGSADTVPQGFSPSSLRLDTTSASHAATSSPSSTSRPLTAPEEGFLSLCQGNTNSPLCLLSQRTPGDVIGALVQFIFVIAVLLTLGFLIFGGVKWITSGGDKSGVEGARGMIIAAIIGLILVTLSFFILNFALQFLTGGTFADLTIPTLFPE